jgi:hypothetical protein
MTVKQEMVDVFERWKSSGLSLRAFGAREGVSYSKLQYWQRKFRDAKPEERKAELARIRVMPEVDEAASEAQVFEVCLANGVGLGVPAGFDERELQRLIGVLSAC